MKKRHFVFSACALAAVLLASVNVSTENTLDIQGCSDSRPDSGTVTKFKAPMLPSIAHITYQHTDGGTCTVTAYTKTAYGVGDHIRVEVVSTSQGPSLYIVPMAVDPSYDQPSLFPPR